ncbi:MAG: hypothetical protein QXV52_06025 [Nitrososphaeria archaeon]
MKESIRKVYSTTILLLLLITTAFPALAATTSGKSYSPYKDVSGVIEADRFDFIHAEGNPLNEDIANAVFQGPGEFRWFKDPIEMDGITIWDDSVGFMKDVHLTITNYGTLTKMNYTGEEESPFHWLPVIEQNPPCMASGQVTTPLEGWAIAYNMTVFPVGSDEGYLIFTFSGFRWSDGKLIANVLGQDEDDNWAVTVQKSTWVENPRLLAMFYNISAINQGSQFLPKFELDIVVIFNKATKFVEIFQNLKLVDSSLVGCISVEVDMALARMAIFDANPYCDRAFYGWKNVTIEDPEFFMVLSWTNATLAKWVRADLGWDYYGAYMASYPVPNSFAIASTWYDSNDTDSYVDAFNVWNAPQLRYTPINLSIGGKNVLAGYLANYTMLYMGDIDKDGKGDGDQALTRVEWYKDVSGMPENVIGTETGWKMIMYGVYDVNGDAYDGGEGGWFKYGYLCLSNGTEYEGDVEDYNEGTIIGDSEIIPKIFGITPSIDVSPPPAPWIHTGTLGWLNDYVCCVDLTNREGMLVKEVTYLDIDQDGNKGAAEDEDDDSIDAEDECDIPYEWWPTEELYWQLTYKFAPPVFGKYPPTTCCMFSDETDGEPEIDSQQWIPEWCPFLKQNDFMVLPAPGATPDAAGAAWLNARFTSMLVTFDVEAHNMIATVGYTNPATKMLPYLMLRLEEIPEQVEDYPARKAHYLTDDGRALPQMEWQYRMESHAITPWRDKHYMVITVAGVHPNLATYYFNDFSPIVRAVGGDYQWDLVVLPTGGPIDISPYVGKDLGKGVIALAKDHFNNIALIVYGLDAQDTYWTAFLATHEWPEITFWFGNMQAVAIGIDYTMGSEWGDGNGIPSAHPTYEDIYDNFWVEAVAIEYESWLGWG